MVFQILRVVIFISVSLSIHSNQAWAITSTSSENNFNSSSLSAELFEDSASVMFQVNMTGQTINPNGVHLAGDFQGWNPSATEMTDFDGDGIYSVVVILPINSQVQFKFINGSAWGSDEQVPSNCSIAGLNRFAVINSADFQLIGPFCFGLCEICPNGIPCQDIPVEPSGILAQVVSIGTVNQGSCGDYILGPSIFPSSTGWNYQWLKNGVPVEGATSETFIAVPSEVQDEHYSFVATCPGNSQAITSSGFNVSACYNGNSSSLNYLLVQNVTTTGNIPGQSVQVQFDLNWGNTWRDDINWDAVWVFMKYKDANGLWKHAKVSPTGYSNGQGTPNLIEPTADQMGAFVRLALEGQGNFSSEGMQLRWNYGADGLASVSGLEVRVFAIEMVYHPQGDFSMSVGSAAPGNKIPVINSRLSPVLSVDGDASVRIKGNAGIDLDANGSVENTTYPTGYYPFYMFKYEMSEQQYADFLNCLTPAQRTTLGVAGSTITQTGGQYFASMPNRACVLSVNVDTTITVPRRIFAYADWAGLRPMSYLEFQKAFNGPKSPNTNGGPCTISDASGNWGSGVYGVKGLAGNVSEPYIRISSTVFNRTTHGNGVLANSGQSDTSNWLLNEVGWFAPSCSTGSGLRLCRTAE